MQHRLRQMLMMVRRPEQMFAELGVIGHSCHCRSAPRGWCCVQRPQRLVLAGSSAPAPRALEFPWLPKWLGSAEKILIHASNAKITAQPNRLNSLQLQPAVGATGHRPVQQLATDCIQLKAAPHHCIRLFLRGGNNQLLGFEPFQVDQSSSGVIPFCSAADAHRSSAPHRALGMLIQIGEQRGMLASRQPSADERLHHPAIEDVRNVKANEHRVRRPPHAHVVRITPMPRILI